MRSSSLKQRVTRTRAGLRVDQCNDGDKKPQMGELAGTHRVVKHVWRVRERRRFGGDAQRSQIGHGKHGGQAVPLRLADGRQ
jgi:hypothetical protein